jgi:lipoprotein-releasing system permease protein
MASDLHILITPKSELVETDTGLVSESVFLETGALEVLKRDPRVVDVWPVLSTEVIMKSGRKVTGVVLKGITPPRLERLKPQLIETAEAKMMNGLPGVMVGQELAYEMGLIPGDYLTLISPTEMDGPMGNIPRLKKFVVEGVYQSGLPEQEMHTLYTRDQHAQSFLRKKNGFTQWEVTVRDFGEAHSVAEKVRPLLGKFRVEDWRDMNAHLFGALQLERLAMFVILTFIVIVASFNIVTTLTLMVLEKKKEIAILKAMGAQNRELSAVFLSEGLLIGGVGTAMGLVLGLALCFALKQWEFIQLPDVYVDRQLPVNFRWDYYGLIAFISAAVVIIACVYPAKRAGRLTVLDGIRLG